MNDLIIEMLNTYKSCVDVIIPTLGKNLDYLHDSIKSVINQEETNKILLCIDNKSMNKTEIKSSVECYSSDKLSIVNNEFNGIGATRNEGLKISTAPYVAMQDDDDVSEKNRFSKQLKLLLDHKAQICFSALKLFEKDNFEDLHPEKTHEAADGFFWKESLILGNTLNNATLFSENFYRKENIYYPLSKTEDYCLWLSIASSKKIYTTSEYLYKYRQHDKQITKNWMWSEVYAEVYRYWIEFYDEVEFPPEINPKEVFNMVFNLRDNYSTSVVKDFVSVVEFLLKNLLESEQKSEIRYIDFLIMRVSEVMSSSEAFLKSIEFFEKKTLDDRNYIFEIFMRSNNQLSELKRSYNNLGRVSHQIRLDNEKLLIDNIKLNKKIITRIINKALRLRDTTP